MTSVRQSGVTLLLVLLSCICAENIMVSGVLVAAAVGVTVVNEKLGGA